MARDLDAEIRSNPDPMELPGDTDLRALIPAYMHWVVQNKDNYDQLVTDWTLNALAEYGRAKTGAPQHMNFKFSCTDQQRLAVCAFLEWSLSALMVVHDGQVERAVKHWC